MSGEAATKGLVYVRPGTLTYNSRIVDVGAQG